ncbi:hypothetical protein [Scytonema sp. HK-05]|uniref:hypothetical protein n=1 Tax=Scytonema sp. HK-05 TaxID=1137095 RepID=UPI001160F6A4|nr:hypothetical protein [Scytonema sp. HK-05]
MAGSVRSGWVLVGSWVIALHTRLTISLLCLLSQIQDRKHHLPSLSFCTVDDYRSKSEDVLRMIIFLPDKMKPLIPQNKGAIFSALYLGTLHFAPIKIDVTSLLSNKLKLLILP